MVLEIVNLFDFLALVGPEHLELLLLLLKEVVVRWLRWVRRCCCCRRRRCIRRRLLVVFHWRFGRGGSPAIFPILTQRQEKWRTCVAVLNIYSERKKKVNAKLFLLVILDIFGEGISIDA